jgi:hypothetical protein
MDLGAFLQTGALVTVGGGPPAAPEKKARKKAAPRDPNEPKRPLTAYLLWLGENREKIHAELGSEQKRGQISSEGTKRWNALPEEVKQVCFVLFSPLLLLLLLLLSLSPCKTLLIFF